MCERVFVNVLWHTKGTAVTHLLTLIRCCKPLVTLQGLLYAISEYDVQTNTVRGASLHVTVQPEHLSSRLDVITATKTDDYNGSSAASQPTRQTSHEQLIKMISPPSP